MSLISGFDKLRNLLALENGHASADRHTFIKITQGGRNRKTSMLTNLATAQRLYKRTHSHFLKIILNCQKIHSHPISDFSV